MTQASILIADDNEQNLYLARYLLERNGHTIHQVSNGEEAVNAAQSLSPKLILMDIQMPIMDGLEATRIIKCNNNTTTIIALTAKVMSGDREAILAAGCDGYIQKPIDPSNFVAQVETYL